MIITTHTAGLGQEVAAPARNPLFQPVWDARTAAANAPRSGLIQPIWLVEGTNFKCSRDFCYGLGDTHTVFGSLQRIVNAIAKHANFKGVSVDGKIGEKTVTAVRSAATAGLKLDPGNVTLKILADGAPDGDQNRFLAQRAAFAESALRKTAEKMGEKLPLPRQTPVPPIEARGELTPADLDTLAARGVAMCNTRPDTAECVEAKRLCNSTEARQSADPSVRNFCVAAFPPPSNLKWILIAGAIGVVSIGTWALYFRKPKPGKFTGRKRAYV